MHKIILILVAVLTVCLFIHIYNKIAKPDNNKIIKNLEEYAEKEKIKQQEPKVLVKRKTKRARNRKESANVYSL